MSIQVGQRLYCTNCSTEVVIVSCSDPECMVECGGHAMTDEAAGKGSSSVEPSDSGTLLGKRYSSADPGLDILCVKAGAGSLSVNGVTLGLKESKPLPASD